MIIVVSLSLSGSSSKIGHCPVTVQSGAGPSPGVPSRRQNVTYDSEICVGSLDLDCCLKHYTIKSYPCIRPITIILAVYSEWNRFSLSVMISWPNKQIIIGNWIQGWIKHRQNDCFLYHHDRACAERYSFLVFFFRNRIDHALVDSQNVSIFVHFPQRIYDIKGDLSPLIWYE